MKRKEMENLVKIKKIERKMKVARSDKNYIKVLYYKFILFLITLFDDISRVIDGFNYKAEYEKQNIQLDIQKKKISDMQKEKEEWERQKRALVDLAHERYLENEEVKKQLQAEKTTNKNLRKIIKEIKGKN